MVALVGSIGLAIAIAFTLLARGRRTGMKQIRWVDSRDCDALGPVSKAWLQDQRRTGQ